MLAQLIVVYLLLFQKVQQRPLWETHTLAHTVKEWDSLNVLDLNFL